MTPDPRGRRSSRRRWPASTACASRRPFAVGRVNCYLLEDEPLTLVDTGPNSGKALDELQGQLRRARPLDRRPRAGDRHPPAHRPPRPGRDHRRALRRRGRRDRRRRRAARQLRRGRRGRGPLRGRADAAQRHLRGGDRRPAERLAQLPQLGLARRGHPAARGRRGDRVPRPHPAGAAPARPQPLRHGLLGRGAPDPDRRRPPARPHLLQPADLAAARRLRRSARRRSSPTSSR